MNISSTSYIFLLKITFIMAILLLLLLIGAYAADVAAQLAAAEVVLKVAGAPTEAAGDTFAKELERCL